MQIFSNDRMAKIHPDQAFPVNSVTGEDKSSPYLTTEQESFTIWMRSLVFHGKGCTVFDSKGNLIYRVDNYNSKSCSEVYLMDLYGKVLFTLRQKVINISYYQCFYQNFITFGNFESNFFLVAYRNWDCSNLRKDITQPGQDFD